MGRVFLSEFEELVLTMVAALGDDAYGAVIASEMEKFLQRDLKLGAVHTTLYRLQDKGYISSKFGGATEERGGRRKRIYTLTTAGQAILHAMQESRIELWHMVPHLKANL